MFSFRILSRYIIHCYGNVEVVPEFISKSLHGDVWRFGGTVPRILTSRVAAEE
jgi:hypothetical protein